MVSDSFIVLSSHSFEIYYTPCVMVRTLQFQAQYPSLQEGLLQLLGFICVFGWLLLQSSNMSMLFSDSNYYKAQALKNAESAYQIHQARVCIFWVCIFWIREVEEKAK